MATEVFVGIDVSKDKVDVACRGAKLAGSWKRTASTLRRLASQLKKIDAERVILEASGGYEQLVLQSLFDAGVRAYLVQAGRARHFARSIGRYAKTDILDAEVLAHMAEVAVEDLRPWEPRTVDLSELRALVHRRDHVVGMIEAEKKRLWAAQSAVKKSIEQVLEMLQAQQKELTSRIEKLATTSEEIAPKLEVLTSVCGVGLVTATTLLAEVPELGSVPRGAVAALVGVAPMTRESGRWEGHRYIVGGRGRARRALYMAAVVTMRHNAHLRPFYERLVAKGKPKKLAIVAVMRKLLIHLNSLVRSLEEASPLSLAA